MCAIKVMGIMEGRICSQKRILLNMLSFLPCLEDIALTKYLCSTLPSGIVRNPGLKNFQHCKEETLILCANIYVHKDLMAKQSLKKVFSSEKVLSVGLNVLNVSAICCKRNYEQSLASLQGLKKENKNSIFTGMCLSDS